MRFPEDHFSYIIIDEASQATEPEMLIPFVITSSQISCPDFYAQVVIVGDHNQLGPVVRSKRSQHLFGKSLSINILRICVRVYTIIFY